MASKKFYGPRKRTLNEPEAQLKRTSTIVRKKTPVRRVLFDAENLAATRGNATTLTVPEKPSMGVPGSWTSGRTTLPQWSDSVLRYCGTGTFASPEFRALVHLMCSSFGAKLDLAKLGALSTKLSKLDRSLTSPPSRTAPEGPVGSTATMESPPSSLMITEENTD